mmetsp:Transcript_12691/g.22969  ORF Transcript_12691/g.22969 Transcript_12691/m.22969 type:complete len:190 (-) Transcript_12691:24-593(-)
MSSEWIGQLGTLHQFRDVSYVEKSIGNVRCLLCGTGWMPRGTRACHFQGFQHARNYDQVRRLEQEKCSLQHLKSNTERTKSLEGRVNSLGLEKWRLHCKALMYEQAVHSQPETICMNVLAKYERMERISLLELAIWKSRICDGLVFFNVDEMRQYPALDEDFDPTDYAHNIRITSGSAIIIPRVMEFLL